MYDLRKVESGVNQVEAKYAKGQKVRIISLKDKHLKAEYPHIEEYVSQTGVVIESHWFGVSKPYGTGTKPPHIIDHHIYDVRLDRDGEIIRAIPEYALELVT